MRDFWQFLHKKIKLVTNKHLFFTSHAFWSRRIKPGKYSIKHVLNWYETYDRYIKRYSIIYVGTTLKNVQYRFNQINRSGLLSLTNGRRYDRWTLHESAWFFFFFFIFSFFNLIISQEKWSGHLFDHSYCLNLMHMQYETDNLNTPIGVSVIYLN